MPSPSKAFTEIPDSAVDANSPLDETLVTALRDNQIFLMEWLGGSYKVDAVVDHDHDDVNSKAAQVADAAVSQAKLKTDTDEVSVVGEGGNVIPSSGNYGFYPQVKVSGFAPSGYAQIGIDFENTDFTTYIHLSIGAGDTAYAQFRYVTSSGEIYWIFILRDKETKKVRMMSRAPDHVCFGNGGDPDKLSHPFPSYDPAKHEIIVITGEKDKEGHYPQFILDIKAAAKAQGKSFLEILMENYEVDEESAPAWPTKEITVGLDDDDIYPGKRNVKLIKKAVPHKPELIHRSLKLKI